MTVQIGRYDLTEWGDRWPRAGGSCELCGHADPADLVVELTAPDPDDEPEPWVHCRDDDGCLKRAVTASLHPPRQCTTCKAVTYLIDKSEPLARPSCTYNLGPGPHACMTRTLREVAASGRPVVIA